MPDNLPDSWQQLQLERIATLQRGFDLPIQNRQSGTVPVYGSNGIDSFHCKHAVKGPGVITGRSGSIGYVFYEAEDFWPLNTTLYVKNFHGNDPRYIARLLESLNLKNFSASTGVPSLNRNFIHPLIVSRPPISEQRAIAAILYTMDEAIRRTEAVIAKLRQVKAGMLHDLLNRGLDENGELRDPIRHPEQFKDSSLGRIPREWSVFPLQKIARVSSGITLGNNPQGTGTIELPYLRVANVQDGYLDLSDVKNITIFKKDINRFALQKGDVLMNEGGDYDKLGRGAVWDGQIEPCLHQNHVFRVRPFPEFLNSYFLDAVSGSQYGKNYFLLSSKQSTNLASINSTQLNNFPIPCPPVTEQNAIVAVLSSHDLMTGQEISELKKLNSLKSGLMQDLLTGRVRVPEAMLHNFQEEVVPEG